MRGLLHQHTEETGQLWTEGAVQRIYDLGLGQPWLTNALACKIVDDLVPVRAVPIDVAAVDEAREILIRRRDTHLDSLAVRVEDPRLRSVLEPIVAGASVDHVPEDDRQFAVDLGLVRRIDGGALDIANPMYRDVIGRALTSSTSDAMPRLAPTWLDGAGRLLPDKLLAAFLAFWEQHADALFRAATYPEIAPHLVLMAFVDRVANGGGSVEREYAAGTGRIDLLLRLGDVKMAFELKAWRDGQGDPLDAGLAQIDRYLARLGLDTGWLVLFDARIGRPPAKQRTSVTAGITPENRRITVVRA